MTSHSVSVCVCVMAGERVKSEVVGLSLLLRPSTPSEAAAAARLPLELPLAHNTDRMREREAVKNWASGQQQPLLL